MKFLRMPHTGNFRVFSHNYSGVEGPKRLAVMLDKIMLRRTYRDKLLGQVIVKLPPTNKKEQWVSFNEIERAVYQICRDRTIQSIKQDVANNNLTMNNVLVRINRLRQVTSHIFLILESVSKILTEEDFENLEQLTRRIENPQMDSIRYFQVRQLRTFLHVRERQEQESNQDSEEQDETRAFISRNVGGRHGLSFQFNKWLEKMKNQPAFREQADVLRCSACGRMPARDPYITSCRHMYCEGCIMTLSESAALSDQSCATCMACGSRFSHSEPYEEDTSRQRGPTKPTSGVFDEINNDEDSEDQGGRKKKRDKWAWIRSQPADILPSAKTTAVKAQILNWIEENPKVKVIVFTQWIGMIHILGKVCESEGWRSFPFHGGMNLGQRQATIDGFRDHDGPCILLSSLKSGGVGLNLTMASKVS
jgi:SNF2 family DNA or RNA helicase